MHTSTTKSISASRRIIATILLIAGLAVGGSALATHPGWYSNTANGGVPGGMGR